MAGFIPPVPPLSSLHVRNQRQTHTGIQTCRHSYRHTTTYTDIRMYKQTDFRLVGLGAIHL